MPFLNIDNNWSNLSQFYNQSFVNRPTIPSKAEQFLPFDDGFIRGGFSNTTLASVKDLVRIGKFITGLSNISKITDIKNTTFQSATKGLLFVTKQFGLQRSNPRIGDVNKTRLYNPLNTLLSVGGNAFGIRFNRFGLTPFSDFNYAEYAKKSEENSTFFSPIFLSGFTNDTGGPYTPSATIIDKIQNTLSTITVKGKTTKSKIQSGYTNQPSRLISHLGKLIDNDGSTNPITLSGPYLGGPDSAYGIGITQIRTTGDSVTNKNGGYSNLSRLGDLLRPTDPQSKYINYYYGPVKGIKFNYTEAEKQMLETSNLIYHFSKLTSFAIGVSDQIIEDPTINENNKSFIPLEYTYGVSSANPDVNIDSINFINITKSKTFYDNVVKRNSAITDSTISNGEYGKDIIKFRIEILNNNEPTSGGVINTEVYAFRAYIDDFNDNIDAKWNPYRYMGRGEEFYIYEGFSRDISVAFTVFAHSKSEMKPIYQKINNLMSSFTPDYSASNLMRGNVGYLTVGDYLYRQPGIFTSMKISNLLDTHWETNLDGDTYELPKYLKISLAFKPIHSFVPRRNYVNKETSAFITPDVVHYNDPYISKFNATKDAQVNLFMPTIARKIEKKQ